MTDEELIARLRSGDTILAEHYMNEAADRIEALTKERDAARQDAKFAEDELEMQEQEACMMENDYIKLEKELDALEAKLTKAVEALESLIQQTHDCEKELTEDLHHVYFCGESEPLTKARATLAEIKGESRD